MLQSALVFGWRVFVGSLQPAGEGSPVDAWIAARGLEEIDGDPADVDPAPAADAAAAGRGDGAGDAAPSGWQRLNPFGGSR